MLKPSTAFAPRVFEYRYFAVALGLVFFLLAACLTRHYSTDWNDNSRMATVEALTVRHTFAIDDVAGFPTGDKYRYHGRFYSDKPPLLAVAGAGIAMALQRVGITFERQPHVLYYVITLGLVGLAYAAGLAAMYETLRLLSAGAVWATCVTLTAGVGTLLLPYTTLLNNHVVSGALVLIGLRALIDRQAGRAAIAAGGAAMALAASIDISFAIFVVLAPLVLARRGLRYALAPFAAAVLPIAALYFAFNVLLSGSLIPPAVNLPLWTYPGSAFDRSNLTGLAVHRSFGAQVTYALDLVAGNHGLFTYMPVLILAAYALVIGWNAAPRYRRELAFIALGCAAYVASYVWSSSDYSGYAYGIRWYAGIAYLAMLPLAFLEGTIVRSMLWRGVFVTTALASTFVATVGLVDPASPNDNGLPPFVHNVQLLSAGGHLAKDVTCALILLLTACALVTLLALLPRIAAAAPRQRAIRPLRPAK